MSWTDVLTINPKTKKPSSHIGNVGIAFRECRLWQEVLAYDEHANRMVLLGKPPSPGKPKHKKYPAPVDDSDVTRACEWLCKHGINVGLNTVGRAMMAVAMERSYHPVREYLHGLAWDGKPRLDTWLITHLGAPDNRINRTFSRKFLIAAVARVERPGCKADTGLVLEGEQGIRKSTAVRIMFDPYFSDHTFDLRDKDASQALQGLWCQEFPELNNVRGADVDTVKAFLSRQEDRFRLPYGHITESYPRQCIFVFTLNPDGSGYLRDATGARRFWIVACGVGWEPEQEVNVEALVADRDQLWAEAGHAFQAGETWWLDTKELKKLQAKAAEERREPDPWEDAVATHIKPKASVTITEILSDVIGIETENQTRREQKRMAAILKVLGWIAPIEPSWVEGVRGRYWTKGESAE